GLGDLIPLAGNTLDPNLNLFDSTGRVDQLDGNVFLSARIDAYFVWRDLQEQNVRSNDAHWTHFVKGEPDSTQLNRNPIGERNVLTRLELTSGNQSRIGRVPFVHDPAAGRAIHLRVQV